MNIRPLDSDEELELVAQRMRATLMEVLGSERGEAIYTMEWIRERARHLRDNGAIFVADAGEDGIVGHTIVRMEPDGLGLFSTTWVNAGSRRCGVAEALLDRGETWLVDNGATVLATNTSAANRPLIALYERRGYTITLRAEDTGDGEMVQLQRPVAG